METELSMSFDAVFEGICRVCLRHYPASVLTSLTRDGRVNDYGLAMLEFANITMNLDDKMPNKMCWKCLKLLRHAILFKLTCEHTYKQLQSLVDDPESDIKAAIVEYSMYKHYFPKEAKDSITNTTFDKAIAVTINTNDIPEKQIEETLDSAIVNKGDIEINEEIIGNEFDEDNWLPSDFEEIEVNIEPKVKLELKLVKKTDKYKRRRRGTVKPKVNNWKDKMRIRKRLEQTLLSTPFPYREPVPRSSKRYEIPDDLTCTICSKKLMKKSYVNHMKRHEASQFICEHCGKAYKTQGELYSHGMFKHDLPARFACAHCDLMAKTKAELRVHLNKHSGERPYACRTCGLTFYSKQVLHNHQYRHAGKRYKCDRCPRAFYNSGDLAAHTNNVHERRYLYRCSVPSCHTVYAKLATVRKHLVSAHGIARDRQGRVERIPVHDASRHSTVIE